MGKLKGVPAILSPDILHLMASSGHGDEIVLADINFPVRSICRKGPLEYRADGILIPDLLDAMLKFLPLDAYTPNPVTLMAIEAQDRGTLMEIVSDMITKYSAIVRKYESEQVSQPLFLNRALFYDRCEKAFAIIQTGDMTPYANIILKRGVVNE